MTKLEQVLGALLAALQGITGPTVERNLDLPEALPAGGLLVLRDGSGQVTDTVLSPLTYLHERTAEVEVIVAGEDAATRDAALDALLVAIDAAIAADRTLGGLAEWAEPAPPDTEGLATEGAPGIKAALVPIVVNYASASALG